jgi:hypothetical protein
VSRIRHIPSLEGRTYCGRDVGACAVINTRTDCVEDAECRSCQRSDDRRTREAYRKTEEHAARAAEEVRS